MPGRLLRGIESVQERRVPGQKERFHLGVCRQIAIHPGGEGIAESAEFGVSSTVVFLCVLHRLPRVDHQITRKSGPTLQFRSAPQGAGVVGFQIPEVVFRLGVHQTKRSVGVGLAGDVGNAAGITPNGDISRPSTVRPDRRMDHDTNQCKKGGVLGVHSTRITWNVRDTRECRTEDAQMNQATMNQATMNQEITRRQVLGAAPVAGLALSTAATVFAAGEKPALLGGPKTRKDPFPKWPRFDALEEKNLLEAIFCGAG